MLYPKLLLTMRTHWVPVLVVFALVGFIINALIFYPGYISRDSASQLCQARGECPLMLWHPPAMTLLWSFLMAATGKVSAMLFFQLALLWSALLLLSWYAWNKTKSKGLSLLVLAFAFMPNVLNISGVIWKDVHVAGSLLLSVAILLMIFKLKNNKVIIASLGLSLLLILYASAVRYNAALFTIPLLFLWIKPLRISKKSTRYAVIASIAVIIVAIPYIINILSGASPKPYIDTYTMTGDVVNMREANEIKNSTLPQGMKNALLDVSDCGNSEVRINQALSLCGNLESKTYIMSNDHEAFRSYWINTIITKPAKFILYKINSFAFFLFPGNDQLISQNGIYEGFNTSIRVKSKDLQDTLTHYVHNFGYKHFSFLYAPWFWLVASSIVIVMARNLKQNKDYVSLLGLSSLLNILSFIPVSLVSDYRYVYWSVFACSMAVLLIIIDRKTRKGSRVAAKNNRGKERVSAL